MVFIFRLRELSNGWFHFFTDYELKFMTSKGIDRLEKHKINEFVNRLNQTLSPGFEADKIIEISSSYKTADSEVYTQTADSETNNKNKDDILWKEDWALKLLNDDTSLFIQNVWTDVIISLEKSRNAVTYLGPNGKQKRLYSLLPLPKF